MGDDKGDRDQMILNIGSGALPIRDAINVDCYQQPYVDQIVDISKQPWPWEDNSIDGIYMFHTLEHFVHPLDIIKECWRILKPGGFLFIVVPHASLINAVGCIGHYHTFSYGTFKDYLGRAWYYNDKPMFKTVLQRLWYLDFPRNHTNPYGIRFIGKHRRPYGIVLLWLAAIIQPLIDLSPRVFERFWHGWCGGAHETVWKGVKI